MGAIRDPCPVKRASDSVTLFVPPTRRCLRCASRRGFQLPWAFVCRMNEYLAWKEAPRHPVYRRWRWPLPETMLMCCRVGRAPSKECPERTEDPQAGGRASKSGLVRLRCGSHGTFLTGSRRPVRSVPCAQSMAMQGDTDSRCTSQHMHPEPEKTDSDGKAHLKEGRLQQLLDAELLART